jgi:hypothetical protein
MATQDLSSAIEQSHLALGAMLRGDPSVYKALFSDEDDVTLGNPFGPYARGRKKVEETLAGAAANYRDGETTHIELVAKYVFCPFVDASGRCSGSNGADRRNASCPFTPRSRTPQMSRCRSRVRLGHA